MRIGTAEAGRGEVAEGYVDLVSFPTGGVERAPVMIARGETDGPTLWITANLHGNEVAGIPVVHRVVTRELASRLRGTVVGVVTLNPSGLRSASRVSHYDSRDPNRLFPDFRRESQPRSTQELINRKVFDEIDETADALIDLHCSNVGSVPFSILDRVFVQGEDERAEAEELAEDVKKIADAFGFPVVHNSGRRVTLDEDLHRSLSGSVVNKARVPAFTAELGSDYVVEREVVDAGVTGVKNVLRRLGMLDGDERKVGGIARSPTDFPVSRTTIESPVSGLLKKKVEPGELVGEGEAVCEITDSFGETKRVIEAERRGWVTSFRLGMGVEEGTLVCYYAEESDGEILEPI
ncbi:MAG: succinylglutamate desuccinylase/aspartoacylase family protein [Halobacteria archaeon]|nr:succinylglutamate desuccinylase/aspartoacylase family protein [Halobacteria archaeon]